MLYLAAVINIIYIASHYVQQYVYTYTIFPLSEFTPLSITWESIAFIYFQAY